MAIILPANTLSGGFSVDNSCRFDDGSSAYVYRNQGTPTGDGKKATISVWLKLGIISSLTASGTNGIFEIRNAGINASFDLYIDGGKLNFGQPGRPSCGAGMAGGARVNKTSKNSKSRKNRKNRNNKKTKKVENLK